MSPVLEAKRGSVQAVPVNQPSLPPLKPGDHLDQKTFHERYEAMPPETRAELIGGIVYMPSPLKLPHASTQPKVSHWLSIYDDHTPGTAVTDSASTILSEDSEVQPDLGLMILPEHGGQLRVNEDEYLVGAPELVVEIAYSSASVDLGVKKRAYEQAGVREYIVAAIRRKKFYWFISKNGRFEPLEPDLDKIYRSQVFPGLWLDAAALLDGDKPKMLAVLRQGLASPQHAEFVAKIAKVVK
jgi:Uma2 family endonuclease